MADTGTLFLDEVGDLPLGLQVRLLRLIQQHEIEKIGAVVPQKVDVRIIAATNRDLPMLVKDSRFREDLYYRLSVVPIHLPSLSNRSGDIPLFLKYFFEKSKKTQGKPSLIISPLLEPYFTAYKWPGNVRQIENTIERMVVLSSGDQVGLDDLPDFLRPLRCTSDQPGSVRSSEGMSLAAVERDLILQALTQFNWNRSRVAKYLGITRKKLLYRIRKHGIAKT